MDCGQIRELLDEAREEANTLVREHLAGCAGCQAYARDWRLARAGFHALREEPVPEATVGFATRLVRRLEEISNSGRAGSEFVERAARRFVYATLLTTFALLLALLAPSSGPLRGSLPTDIYMAETQIGPAAGDPIFADEFPEPAAAVPVNGNAAGEEGQK
jgi:hypothetical protein